MLRFLLILGLLAPTTLLQAAVEIRHLSVDKPSYVTGERVQVTMRVLNTGNAAVQNVRASVFFGSNSFIVAMATPQWSCPPSLFRQCTLASLGAGAESELRVTMLAPPRAPSGLTAAVGNDTESLSVAITPAANHAELTLKAIPSANPILPGEAGEIVVLAENSGPDDVRDVHVDLLTAPFSVNSEGWTCTQSAATGYSHCVRPVIPAFTSAPITLRFTAPSTEGLVETWGRIQAELNRDDDSNELLSAQVIVGNPANWQRYLVPITATKIPGANASLWRTDITMLFRGERPGVVPDPCNLPITCLYPIAPLNRPFDAHTYGYAGFNAIGGQFLHVLRDDVHRVAFNARFYDESRLLDTAGTELPIVRAEKFRTGTVSLINIPIAAEYRHTLRIYDGDGRDTTVTIRAYANDETTPRITTTRHLTKPYPDEEPSLTPLQPAYHELALAQLLPLDGLHSVRLEIEPVTPGSRIWAFVSITNNATHHVTLVTPQ